MSSNTSARPVVMLAATTASDYLPRRCQNNAHLRPLATPEHRPIPPPASLR